MRGMLPGMDDLEFSQPKGFLPGQVFPLLQYGFVIGRQGQRYADFGQVGVGTKRAYIAVDEQSMQAYVGICQRHDGNQLPVIMQGTDRQFILVIPG